MPKSAPIEQAPESTQAFPLALFVVAFVASISTTLLMMWQAHRNVESAKVLSDQHVTLTDRVGKIMQYDEVLTMSARQCAATGDFAYERRYDEFDPKLAAEIEALRGFIPSVEIAGLVGATDEANTGLIAIERQAFLLAHEGRGQEGLTLLEGKEYGRLKGVYARGMTGTTDAAKRVIDGEYRQLRERGQWFAIGSSIGVGALIIAWVAAMRSARAWVALRARVEQERYQQLEAIGREKDEFLATVSHSLKTPLNHILGFAGLLKEGRVGNLSPKQQEFVEDIFVAGSGELAVVDSLIELAEVQASKVPLRTTAQDPRAAVDVLVRNHQGQARLAGVALAIEIDGDLGTVPLDERIVGRILGILLDNALRFTPAGGTVTLAARRVTRADVEAPIQSQSADYLELTVRDTGPGIAPEVLRRLFRPFVQGDGRLARSHQGTGIGLTLARKLAELHRGWCGVRSELGAGATFFVWLPAEAGVETPVPLHDGNGWRQ